ncbi:major facilitator superfamily domain-containing protein [Myxozyma melibiosi]|uniref:Major facilitator superfamily domain-containing protein n=1 Tax=Myxozyma melibiosi TaxID=54550 RepID=A0ABR1F3K7_9ASCO
MAQTTDPLLNTAPADIPEADEDAIDTAPLLPPQSGSGVSDEDVRKFASIGGIREVEVDLSTLYGGEFEDVVLPPSGSAERAAMEKAFKRKIDYAILPVVIAMYMLNYLDRNNIAAAKLGSLMEDLNLTSTQYSTAVSVLFIPYTLMQVPSNLILGKIGKPSVYLPSAMVIWGMLSLWTTFVSGYRSLVTIRFLIGFAEAAFYPGTMFYLSCWYTKYEIAKRSAIFVCGSWVSGAFSGLVAYGVLENLDGVFGLAAWRWLFLIEGTLTVIVALIAIPILPNLPATTKWLSKEERLLGVLRMINDVGQHDDDSAAPVEEDEQGRAMAEPPKSKFQSALAGLYLALVDKKVLIILWMQFSLAMMGGINTVFPTIVGSLGYGQAKTLLLTAPPWLLCSVTSVWNSFHSDKTGERYLHMVWGPALAALGIVISMMTQDTFWRYLSMLLMLQNYNSWSLGFAWMATTVPRPPIKRAAAVSFVNIGGNVPNIIVPYLFYVGSEPQFYVGFAVCGFFALSGIVAATVLKGSLVRLNKKLERGGVVDGLDGTTGFRFIF